MIRDGHDIGVIERPRAQRFKDHRLRHGGE
jgi:hypothetical protein